MNEDRFNEELEACHNNIIFLYKKELQTALQQNDFIKAQFIRIELNNFLSGEI